MFENDMANGLGIYKWMDGKLYDDEWVDNKPKYPEKIKVPNGRFGLSKHFEFNL